MSKIALLKFNPTTSKWEVSYGGHVLLKSGSKEYVVNHVRNGTNPKIKQLGITDYEELGQPSTGASFAAPKADESDPALNFSINERFSILEDFVDMVGTGTLPSAVITGEGGLGKSHTVYRSLERAGLPKLSSIISTDGDDDEEGGSVGVEDHRKGYVVIKGYSTPKGLYRTLYENRHKICVFDDCDDILKNQTAVNILKAALDSYDVREVTWNSEGSFGGESDLPKSFIFDGGVIFISNMPMYKMPQAIISRSLPADVSMTRSEIVERMRAIVDKGEFLPEYEDHIKKDALDFIAANAHRKEIKSLNLRSLIAVTKVRFAKPDHWKRLGLYAMINA